MKPVLVTPAPEYLTSYRAALETGWSPDNTRAVAAQEEMARLDADPDAFAASLTDREARGGDITLADGSRVRRLPGFRRWLWDGAFCGSFGLRWQAGTEALPPHVLGHIGYAVVPWKRQQGMATEGLRQMLVLAAQEGLRYVELTTDPDNIPSQKVILSNGGALVERFIKGPEYGHAPSFRYRIGLQ